MPTATPPTRKQRRDDARRARIERERAESAAAARKRRLAALGGVTALAAVVVAVLIAVSSSGGGTAGTSSSSPAAVEGTTQASSLFTGVPQKGVTLGAASAPVRVVEFADLQCPFCRDFAVQQLPGIVRDYVKPGKVRMEFRALAFIGPDSERAARFAQAAAAQDKLWNVVDLLYANQGAENSGWATDGLLRGIAGSVPGLDARRVLAERDGAAVTRSLEAAETLAQRSGVQSTPTFLVGRGDQLRAVDAAGVRAAIDAALAR